jgi:ribonuclease BN (tRNA processing enzyme)
MKIRFVGCGDAFASGARLNTCIHIADRSGALLVDCGATALYGLKRLDIDTNDIDAILLTHFHADHCGGIPFFILHAQFNAKRRKPLLIAGPPGLSGWFARAMALAFPGERTLPFELSLHEVEVGRAQTILNRRVTAFPVRHDERAGPCLAYRIESGGKTFCYSGDTEWTDTLVEAAQDADLFVCECYTFDAPRKSHMALSVLRQHLPRVNAKRVLLTHLGEDMLARLPGLDFEAAADGMSVEI